MSSVPQTSYDQQPLPIDIDNWASAEQRIEEILGTFRPTELSQQKRSEVIEYLTRLINDYFHYEAFPYGSVPLRTYLPEGDIDMTVLCHQSKVEDLIRALCAIAAVNSDEEFRMRDLHVIRAQVKIVKLRVKNIPVDISFNQVAGFGALCFLERVDRLIGRHHLFKRSLLLVKAWCFYEGRVLGSHRGCLSTYGLEIMVLYIINLFHASVRGPLGVLHKFLEYYSNFSWKTHCVSIYGPVQILSLPRLVVDSAGIDVNQPLLSNVFLRSCKELFMVSDPDASTNAYFIKHMNIIDPLNESNNLGRSVSKANAIRIQNSLTKGSESLGRILMLPMEQVVRQLEGFFRITLQRNDRGMRADVGLNDPTLEAGRFDHLSLYGEYDSYHHDFLYSKWLRDRALASDQTQCLAPPTYYVPPPPQPSPMNLNVNAQTPFQFQNHAMNTTQFQNHAMITVQFQNQAMNTVQFQNQAMNTLQSQNQAMNTVQFQNLAMNSVQFQNQAMNTYQFQNHSMNTFQFQNQAVNTCQFQKQAMNTFQFQNQVVAPPLVGTDVVVQSPVVLHPVPPPVSVSYSGLARSRGTGTFIPNMPRHHPPRRSRSWHMARSLGSLSWNPPAIEEDEESEVHPVIEEGEGSGSALDLSQEQLPLPLSPMEPIDAAENAESNQSEVITPQAGELEIFFGSFRTSLGEESSSSVTAQNFRSSEKGKEIMVVEGTDESSPMKPFQLKDVEFPPLP